MSPPKPQPLSYRSATPIARSGSMHFKALAVTLAAWTIVLSVSLFIVPRFETIFKDFKTDLPSLTKLVLKLNHRCSDYGSVLGPLVVVPYLLIVLTERTSADPELAHRRSRLLIAALISLLGLYLLLTALAMLMPITGIVQSVSGSPKK